MTTDGAPYDRSDDRAMSDTDAPISDDSSVESVEDDTASDGFLDPTEVEVDDLNPPVEDHDDFDDDGLVDEDDIDLESYQASLSEFDGEGVAALIEWSVLGLRDEDGKVLSRHALRKNPPLFIIEANGDPVASLDLTPPVAAKLLRALSEVSAVYQGKDPLQKKKTFTERIFAMIDWCLTHKIRGALAAILVIAALWSILVGFGIIGF